MAMPEHHPVPDWLAYAADQVDVPKGYRVEIIEGNIVVSPTPQGFHAVTTRSLRRAIEPMLPDGAIDLEMISFELPESGQRYVPDLVVVPSVVAESSEWLFPASEALLVAEVTSPGNGDNDRIKKLRGYATSLIPIDLLIDREARTVTVFTEPADRAYRRHTQVPFGEPVELPEPFAGWLDTAQFT